MDTSRIMIVEDESLVGLDLQHKLNDMGYRVTSVYAEAQMALDKIAAEPPDLILMDIQLRGEMDGIDAAREISLRHGLPVLFLTAFADSETLARASEVGAYGYMVKPFSISELRAMVEIALRKHSLDQEQSRLDARIRRAQKYESLRLMAGGIAHRFNNTMQVVLGNISFALLDLPADSPALESLKRAEQAAVTASDLGSQLLACSGRGFYNSKKMDLTRHINQTLLTIQAVLPDTVKMKLELAEELPLVMMDPGQLELVLTGLVTNSVESFEIDEGFVTVQTSARKFGKNELAALRMNQFLAEGLYVCLTVSDNGCGMNSETVRKVFDPFFTTKFTGRGLGLATTLGVVQAHHGTIRVESEPGLGTKVEVLFPVIEKVAAG